MSSKQRFTATCVLSALILAALVGCSSPVEFRFSPKAGDTRTLRITSNQSVTVDAAGEEVTQPDNSVLAFAVEVENVDASGSVELKATFEQADFGDMGPLAGLMGGGLDEGIPQGDLGLVGKSLTVTVAPDGFVEGVQGMRPIVDEVAAKVSEMMKAELEKTELPPEAMAQINTMTEGMASMFQSMLGDRAMAEQLGAFFTMYPKEPVRVGGEWAKGFIRSSGVTPMVESQSWKLVERKDGLLKLEVETAVSPNDQASGLDLGGITMRTKYSGQMRGTVTVEEATGWPVRHETTYELEAEMTMDIPGMSGVPGMGNTEMKMKIEGSTTAECTAS